MRHMLMPRGYSLIELLVVVVVLGVLATAAFPIAEITVQRDREHELKRALWEIRDAIDAYKRASDAGAVPKAADGSGYPATLDVLADGRPGTGSAAGRLFFLRRIPRDPFADSSVPPAQTWGLRSYQSAPERPQAGADVYDVYSRSDRIGLNGLPLKDW